MENARWQLPKKILSIAGEEELESRQALEKLGFIILEEGGDDLSYEVVPPDGWIKMNQGNHSTIYAPTNNSSIPMQERFTCYHDENNNVAYIQF